MSVTGNEFRPNEAEMDTVYPESPPSPSVPPASDAPGRPSYQDKIDEVMRTDLDEQDRRMPAAGLREGGPGEGDEPGHESGGVLPQDRESGSDTKGHG